jgi:hypothetical protein
MTTLAAFIHDRAASMFVEAVSQAIATVIAIIVRSYRGLTPMRAHYSSFIQVIFTIVDLIYNVFFHPLRNYSGPILAQATNLTWHMQSSKGQSVLWMHRLHEKFGPVVRYSPNKLSSTEPETWKEIYGHHVPQWPNFFRRDPYRNEPGLIRAYD